MPTPLFSTAIGSVRPVGQAAGGGADAITYTREYVEDLGPTAGSYVVRGVAVPHRGSLVLAVGDQVTVQWGTGVPAMILDYQVRRGGAADVSVATGGVVEELLITTDPKTGQQDVFFRNWSVCAPLNITSFSGITSGSLSDVRWGPDGNTFGVSTTVIAIISFGPIVTHVTTTIHVFSVRRPKNTVLANGSKPKIRHVASYVLEDSTAEIYPSITYESVALFVTETQVLTVLNNGGATPAITPQTINAAAKSGTVSVTWSTPAGDAPVTQTDENVVRVVVLGWSLNLKGEVLAVYQVRVSWGSIVFYAVSVLNVTKGKVVIPATFDGSSLPTGHGLTAVPGATGFAGLIQHSGLTPFTPLRTFEIGLYWCRPESATTAGTLIAACTTNTMTWTIWTDHTVHLTNRRTSAAVLRGTATTVISPDAVDPNASIDVPLSGSGIGYVLNRHRIIWTVTGIGVNGYTPSLNTWSMTDYVSHETKVVATDGDEFFKRFFVLLDPNLMYQAREPLSKTDKTFFFVRGWKGVDGAITLDQSLAGYPTEDGSLKPVKAFAKLPAGVSFILNVTQVSFHAVADLNLLPGRK